MDELLKKINELMERKKMEPIPSEDRITNETIFTIKQKEFDVDKNIFPFFIDFGERPSQAKHSFFQHVTGLFSYDLKNISFQKRGLLRDELTGFLSTFRFKQASTCKFFKNNILFTSERLRMVTKGKKISSFYFMTEEELDAYMAPIHAILIAHMNDWLGFEDEKYETIIIENLFKIISHPCTDTTELKELLSQPMFEKMFPLHKVPFLMKLAYDIYQKENLHLFDILIHDPSYIGERLFLFNTSQIKDYQKDYSAYFRELLDSFKKDFHSSSLSDLKYAKDKMEIIKSWVI